MIGILAGFPLFLPETAQGAGEQRGQFATPLVFGHIDRFRTIEPTQIETPQ